jgi:hypothetical protein
MEATMLTQHPYSARQGNRRDAQIAWLKSRQTRRNRTRQMALAMGVAGLALLALTPAGQAQAPAAAGNMPEDIPATTPATPGPAMAPAPAPAAPAAPSNTPSLANDPAVNLAAPATPPLPPPPPRYKAMQQLQAGPVSYICGGVAQDEQRTLNSMAGSYNMNLLFTQGGRGEYLSDVTVRLSRGGKEVASFVADGPRCLVKAPSGTYHVQATYEGRMKTASVSTGAKPMQMRW